MKKLLSILIIPLVLLGCNTSGEKEGHKEKVKAAAASTEFDVVILNGRLMDPETNFDQIQNVGVLDGKIALITDKVIPIFHKEDTLTGEI